MNDGPKDGPGPSRRFAKAHPERVYGGPDPVQFKSSNMHKMTASQAEAYYAKLPDAHQPILPRTSRFAGIGAWVLGAGGGEQDALTTVACGYMVLYADFGDHEHVFSPVGAVRAC